MKRMLTGVMAVAAIVVLAGATYASAQSSAPRPNPSAQSPATPQEPPASQNPSPSERGGRDATVSGELTRVTPDTKMFTVKNATGEIQFKYSEATIITGAQKTVAGLATMSGEQVTVTYRVEGGSNMATKIDVKEKK